MKSWQVIKTILVDDRACDRVEGYEAK